MAKAFHYLSTHYFKRIWSDASHLFRGKDENLVSFLVCGAQKSGTTALDNYLRQHPSICMAVFKEVHFFDREKHFIYPHVNYQKYLAFFEPNQSSQILGETTPSYLYWYTAPRRIWEYNPNMRLIIILRNPIERAFSHWNMQRERGVETLTFMKALEAEEERRKSSLPLQNKRFSYLDRGFYTEQIRRLRAFFPAEQIMLLRNQELQNNPESVLSKISQFLEIDSFPEINHRSIHGRPYNRKMTESEWKYLKNCYRWEIKKIENMTGWDCQDWLTFQPESI